MLTLQECLDFSGLAGDEIDAIAEHEHIPVIVAAELGNCLLATSAGRNRIRSMINDDLANARKAGDVGHVTALQHVLCRYNEAHPD